MCLKAPHNFQSRYQQQDWYEVGQETVNCLPGVSLRLP
jgi:hypothetical protein